MRLAASVLTVFVCITCCGCAALVLGGAAAGAAGVAYAHGDIERMYPYPIDVVWNATLSALGELQLQIAYHERDQLTAEIKAFTAAGDKVKVEMESHGPATELELRVNTFGNRSLEIAIMSKIDQYLSALPPSGPYDPYYDEPADFEGASTPAPTPSSPTTPTM